MREADDQQSSGVTKSVTREPVLQTKGLSIELRAADACAVVVENLTFDLFADEVVGLVGESGSGKTMTALGMMGLLPRAASVTAGDILVKGQSVIGASKSAQRALRGETISMVFQEPMTSLDPSFTVGHQIAEVYRTHRRCTRGAAKQRAIEMLDMVRIASAGRRFSEYPHQFSGGMRQRAALAMALCCAPDILIADEPTTALDVTVQAQILELLDQLRSDLHMSVLMVTHDLGVVAQSCDRVVVMYAGEIVEAASATAAFARPMHPYTSGMLASLPKLGVDVGALSVIPGRLPDIWSRPTGCQFEPRCTYAVQQCRRARVPLEPAGEARVCRCVRSHELALPGVK